MKKEFFKPMSFENFKKTTSEKEQLKVMKKLHKQSKK